MGLGALIPNQQFTPLNFGMDVAPERFAGMTSALGGIGGIGQAAGGAPAAAGLLGKVGGLGALGKASGYALGGQLASGLFDKVVGDHSGTWDDAGKDALAGAGIGAGLGSIIPIPGIGTGVGALVGGAAGGLYGLLFGDKKTSKQHLADSITKADTELGSIMSQAQLSPEARHSIATQLKVATMDEKDPKKIHDIYIQVAQAIPAIADQEAQQRRQLTNLLASQQVMAPQFDNFLKSMGASKQAFVNANNTFADTLSTNNPAAGAFIRQQGAASILSDSATAAAYHQQLGGQVQQLAGQINAPESITQQLMAQYG